MCNCRTGTITVTILLVITTTKASPIKWTRSLERELEPEPSTLIPWTGHTYIPGAVLISRVNLFFINETCSQFSKTLDTASQLAIIIFNNTLRGADKNQVMRYGYVLLQIETGLQNTLEYLTNLLLCSGRGGELWGKFTKMRKYFSSIWKLLNNLNVSTKILSFEKIVNSSHSVRETDNAHDDIFLINLLEKSRPPIRAVRKPKAIFLAGAGLGILGGLLISKIFGVFGDNNAEAINNINKNLEKTTNNLKLTNERIDILAQNVTRSHLIMKDILDKLVENNINAHVHYAILWNLDQLVLLNKEIKMKFRLGELTLTLLEEGILNPELLELNSLQAIVSEGLKLFPELTFPLEITRYQLEHIVKLIRIEKIGRMKYVMMIPLTKTQRYDTYTLIPHPIKISDNALALPQLQNTLLINKEETYVITKKENIYSISDTKHILLETHPIYRQTMVSCEWAAFKKRIHDMIRLCNFRKAGGNNDTLVIDTENNRLVYFTKNTKVDLNCPSKHITTNLQGLHNISASCSMTTNNIHWPSKQTAEIDVEQGTTNLFDATELPIANIGKSMEIHDSLRELIKKLPKENDSYTIDFEYYNLMMEQLHTYTIFSQTVISTLVIINSIISGFLLYKWKSKTKTSFRDRFRKLGDSLKRQKLQFRKNLKTDEGKYDRNIQQPIELRDTEGNPTIPESKESIPSEPPPVYPALQRYIY